MAAERSETEALTQAVLARLADAPDPRLKTVMTALVRHLHDFVREVRLSEAEWAEAIRFLTETGQRSDAKRQEFILLSDTLGVSMLVDALNRRWPAGATPSTVLGPFFVEGAPELPDGANIMRGQGGLPAVVSGRVLASDGRPVAGASLDVWQTAPNGLYDVQDATQPEMNLRGRFLSRADGGFRFRTVKPVSYPVPTDGPAGRMLRGLGRHAMRPAHIHFIVEAPGFERLTTHLFVAGDPYLDSDAVFGVKPALVVPFRGCEDAREAAAEGVSAPFCRIDYDFRLVPLQK